MRLVLVRSALLAGLLVLAAVLAVFVATQWFAATARSDADDLRQASSVAAVADLGPDVLARVVARMPAGAEGRLAVHLPGGESVGVAGHVNLGSVRDGVPRVESGTLLYPAGDAVVEVRARDTGDWRAAGARFVLLFTAGLLASGSGVVLVLWRSRRTISGLRALVRATRELQPGGYRTPLRPGAVPELVDLSMALAHVSGRWAGLLTDERKVMADLSHRLRTPLTALRLDADGLSSSSVGDRIRRSVRALEREVDEVITGPGEAAPAQPCEVSAVVVERMEFWHTLAEAQSRTCTVSCTDEPTAVPLTQRALVDVLDSLLVNVFQHTAPGVPFAAQVVRHAGWVTLVVEDGGPGIADPRSALRRGTSSAGSTGLGLDIVRQSVEAAGGAINLERSALGGARVRLRFPEAGSSPSAEPPLAWRLWSATR